MNSRLILSALCMASLVWQAPAAEMAGPASPPVPPTASAHTPSMDELQKLREQIAQQKEEIERLQKSVDQQQKLLEQTIQNATAAAAKQNSTGPATGDSTPVVTANATAPVQLVPAVNVVHPHWAPRAGQQTDTRPSPLSVSIGNSTFTPLGFVDATFFARSTNVGSGIGTNFAGIPYNTSATSKLSETNFSAQNSRIGLRIDSTFDGAKVLGYLETDFLFNNDAASYQITSNSAALRLRNYFVDVTKNGFEILAGQDWSFLTPNRKGLSPIPADIFYTQNMDTNYQVGLIWTRQPQFRFIGHPSDNFAFGVSLENPQQYIGGGSGASIVTLPSALNTALSTQFESGTSATGTPNWFPDIIFKGAYDGKAGSKNEHIEAAVLIRGFKDYIASTTPPAIQGTHSAIGASGSVNGNFEITRNVRLIANTFFGQGGGRYIFGIAPDVVVRPDGSISPLHSYSTVDGFEAQVTKNTLLAAYYGGAFIGRESFFDPTATGSTPAKPVYAGYGFSGSSNQNRNVQQITFDWVQTLWKSPNYGALSLINQYSYLFKAPWYNTIAGPKQAHSNLVYVNVRYTLP